MKKCPKCGVELPDEAAFCNNCGENLAEKPAEGEAEKKVEEPVVAPVSANNQVLENAKEQNKNTKIGIIAVVGVAAVLVLIILIALISSVTGGPKSIIKAQMKAFEKGDVKTLYGSIMPANVLDDYYDDMYDIDFKEYCEAVQPVYDTMWEGLKDEGKVKFSYEIKDVESVDKLKKLKSEAKGMGIKDLDDLRDVMEDDFDEYDLDSSKISKAYIAEVKWELLVDKDKACKGTEIMVIYKYKGKMYVVGSPEYSSVYYNLDKDDYEDVIDDMEDAIDDYHDEIY